MTYDPRLGTGIRVVMDPQTEEAVPVDSERGRQLLPSRGNVRRITTEKFIMPPRLTLKQLSEFAAVSAFGPTLLVLAASWQRKVGLLKLTMEVCAAVGIRTRKTRGRVIEALVSAGLLVRAVTDNQAPVIALAPRVSKGVGVPDYSAQLNRKAKSRRGKWPGS